MNAPSPSRRAPAWLWLIAAAMVVAIVALAFAAGQPFFAIVGIGVGLIALLPRLSR